MSGAADIPVLDEGFAALDLPPGCALNADGSVTVTFDRPATVRFRTGSEEKTETHEGLTLRRLTGAQVLKAIEAKKTGTVALAFAAGLSPARLALLTDRADAADVTRLMNVVSELLGGLGEGLPEHAAETEDGVTLPLRDLATDGDDGVHESLTFRRLTGGDLEAMAGAKDTLQVGIHRATGLTLKAVKGMLPVMDGADVMDAQRVIGFLSGSGRRTGR